MFRKDILIYVCFSLSLVLGCSSEGCYEDIDADLIISVYETDNEDLITTDSLTVYGLDVQSDSLYIDATEQKLSLPLNAGTDQSAFIVINGLIADTVSVQYSSRYNFVSKGCGYNYLHTIESVTFTKNRLDTILIISSNVTPEDEENLRAFF